MGYGFPKFINYKDGGGKEVWSFAEEAEIRERGYYSPEYKSPEETVPQMPPQQPQPVAVKSVVSVNKSKKRKRA